MNLLRVFINFFIALMISVIGMVVDQRIVEYPIELYYNMDVDHTSEDYSYKPGQSGTEYTFYIHDGLESKELGVVHILFIPAFFYWFFINLIGLLRRLFIPQRISLKPSKDDYNPDIPVKLFRRKTREEKKASNYYWSLVCMLISLFFIYSGYWNWFRIGI